MREDEKGILWRITSVFIIFMFLLMPANTAVVFADDDIPQPASLDTSYISASAIGLSWDIEGGYAVNIYRDGDLYAELGTEDSYVDDDVDAGTEYDYEVAFISQDGDEGPKSSITAQSKSPEEPPVITDVTLDEDSDPPLLNIETDEYAFGSVKFTSEDAPDEEISVSPEDDHQTSHEVSLDALQEGNLYEYVVELCNAEDECASSESHSFMYGGYEDAPPVEDIKCEEFSKNREIMVGGHTRPRSEVRIHRDGSHIMSRDVPDDGLFVIERVPLSSDEEVEIVVEVVDMSGNSANKTCNVVVEGKGSAKPPSVDVDSFPEYTSESELDVSLETDTPIDLYISRVLDDDHEAPGDPGDLEVDEATDSKIALSWDGSESGDAEGYIIYRDDTPIDTVSSSSYTDEKVISDTAYEYRVRPIDSSCELGPFSDPVDAKTDEGTYFSLPPREVEDVCRDVRDVEVDEHVESEFSGTISLESGLNILRLRAVDEDGNVFSRDYEVELDDEELTFVESNLDEYSDDVIYSFYTTIRGKTSKPSDITIVLNEGKNGEEEYTTSTDSSGKFSQKVHPKREFNALVEEGEDPSELQAEGGFKDTEWPNDVAIYAEDRFGNEATDEGTITPALCGGGDRDFNIDFDSFMPSEIIPRHLIEGIATIGFGVELDSTGPEDNISDVNMRVVDAPMAAHQAQGYNADWIQGEPEVNQMDEYAYTQIRLKLPDGHSAMDDDKSMLEREKEVAKTNKGHCLVSDMALGMEDVEDPVKIGCVRLALMIELEYSVDGEDKVQKECLDMAVQIDNRVDTDKYLPNDLMEWASDVASWTRDKAEELKEYTEPLVLRSTQACFATVVGEFAASFKETYDCTRAAPHMNDHPVVEDGEEYTVEIPDDEEDAKNAEKVQSCFDSMSNAENIKGLRKLTCGRVACNSVPSFEKYIDDEAGEIFEGISDSDDMMTFIDQSGDFRPSYCARFKDTVNDPDSEHDNNPYRTEVLNSEVMGRGVSSEDAEPPYEFDSEERVLSMFKHEDGGTWQEVKQTEWCEKEYQYEHEYDCLFRNPYKESFCMFGSNNREKVQTSEFEEHCADDTTISLGDLSRKLNFCNDMREDEFGIIQDDDYFWIEPSVETKIYEDSKYVANDVMLLDVDPQKFTRSETERGSFELSSDDDRITSDEEIPLSLDLFTANLEDPDACGADSSGEACESCAAGNVGHPCCPRLPHPSNNQMTPAIANYMCTSTEASDENILDPAGGIYDALTCGCFSAIDAYLDQIAQVSGLIADCFKSVEETGDGDAGMCQQAFSQYICDLFYTAFDCFTSYAGAGVGIGQDSDDEEEDSSPGVMDALSATGRRMSSRIENDYGDTAMYEHLFVDKNFANSLCYFMLHGELPDGFFEGVAEAARDETPVEPVLNCGADIRFQTFDSTTGIATHVYEVSPFVISGAPDTNVDIELVCSTESGSDCQHIGERKTYDVSSQFSESKGLARGDELNEQEFIVVDATSPNKGHYRYDKVKLTARYENNDGETVTRETECSTDSIIKKGGDAPGFCEFDVLDGKYHCNVAAQDGSARFVEDPEPVRDTIYLDDPVDKRTVEFHPYTVRRYTSPGTSGTPVELRIIAETSAGEEYPWTARGSNVKTITITSDSAVRFGKGADSESYDVPRFTIDRSDFRGDDSVDCRLMTDRDKTERRTCEMDSHAYRIEVAEEGVLDAQPGHFDTQEDEFVPDEDRSAEPVSIIEYDEDDHKDVYEFSFAGLDLRYEVDNFPIVIRQLTDREAESKVQLTFQLRGEDGSIIRYNGQQQTRSVTIDVEQGTGGEDIEDDGDENDSCPDPGNLWMGHEPDSCTCGSSGEGCREGEKCCVAPDYKSRSFPQGYCIDVNGDCDTKLPQLDEIDVDVSSDDDGLIVFTLDDVIDEVSNIEDAEYGIRVFLEFSPYRESGDLESKDDPDDEE
ncbi:MAG: hypothetical protein ACLFNK_03045, partial [Candidatus Woesearchaeota archaeon]